MFNTPNDLRLPGTEDWYLIISLPNLWDLQLLLKKKGGVIRILNYISGPGTLTSDRLWVTCFI